LEERFAQKGSRMAAVLKSPKSEQQIRSNGTKQERERENQRKRAFKQNINLK